jgi:hypothetical protein
MDWVMTWQPFLFPLIAGILGKVMEQFSQKKGGGTFAGTEKFIIFVSNIECLVGGPKGEFMFCKNT